MRRLHGKRINNDFLNHIEERPIVFIEDGTDLREVNLGKSEGPEIYQEYSKLKSIK